MGARLSATGTVVRVEALRGGLRPLRLAIPGDFSSAAFWFGAAAMRPGACVRVVDVGLNPSRTAFLWMLRAMGAEILIEAAAEGAVEPSGRVTVTGAPLRAIAIDGPQVAAAIDEIPILMVVATQAAGTTSITGAAELRVKESDRISALAAGFRAMGGEVEEFPDGFVRTFDLRGGSTTTLVPGVEIPIVPFCGTMGNCPDREGTFIPFPPHEGGGNIDTRHLTAGTTFHIPVLLPGAHFSIGDPHAAQGDGETARATLDRALATYRRLGMDAEVMRTQERLIGLAHGRGPL